MRYAALIVLLVLLACQKNIKNEEPIVSAPETESVCTDQALRICPEGLSFIKLGQGISELDTQNVDPAIIIDELNTQNGYQWVSRTIKFAEGDIIIEGQFIPEAEANDTILSMTLVNRMRIEVPSFTTPAGLSVGQDYQTILEAYADKEAVLNPLPDYGMVELRFAEVPYIFLFKDPNNQLATQNQLIQADQLAKDSRVEAIVVM